MELLGCSEGVERHWGGGSTESRRSLEKKKGEAARLAGIGGPAGLFIAKGEGGEHKGILGIEFGRRRGRIGNGGGFSTGGR